MPKIRILQTGRLDERESAFPQAVQLANGDILCSYCVGGGCFVDGGTEWSRSCDGGLTWTNEGVLMPPTTDPVSANFLKLSLSADGNTIYAYGTRYWGSRQDKFGERRGEAVFCVSTDGGKTWSRPALIPMPDCPLEISHGILPLSSGRLLAPTATLPAKDRLGEEVLVAVSDDDGASWPHRRTVFRDPQGKFGYWEQKLARVGQKKLMAVAWTVSLGDYRDQCNSFAISADDGWTWSAPRSTEVRGQTMTPHWLGEDRLLVLFNRRYGQQGIVAGLFTFDDVQWMMEGETLMYDAGAVLDGPFAASGVDELNTFQFGFPTAICLNDGSFLATFWSVEQSVSGIRWVKLAVDW